MPEIEFVRHCRMLGAEETDLVVDAIADLVVDYILGRREPTGADSRQEGMHDQDHVPTGSQ